MKKRKTASYFLDWKQRPTAEGLQKRLKRFGVFVYSPHTRSDDYCFIFSDRPLSDQDLHAFLKRRRY